MGLFLGSDLEKSEGVSEVAESKGEFTRGGVSGVDGDAAATKGVDGARPL